MNFGRYKITIHQVSSGKYGFTISIGDATIGECVSGRFNTEAGAISAAEAFCLYYIEQ